MKKLAQNRCKKILVLILALPILFICVTFFLIYLNHRATTNYDFLFTEESHRYEIVGDKLSKKALRRGQSEHEAFPGLYIYDVSEDKSYSIYFEEANQLSFLKGAQSPEGFYLTPGSVHEGVFALTLKEKRDYSQYFLKNPKKDILLPVNLNRENQPKGQKYFVGWIN
jgi:hypothetical protein